MRHLAYDKQITDRMIFLSLSIVCPGMALESMDIGREPIDSIFEL